MAGRGRDVKVSGAARRGSSGEYLYLPSQASTGSARAPYSTAYPQYRREAERAVRRSQVPPHLRSVVRSYFDAINPDGKKNEYISITRSEEWTRETKIELFGI